MTVSFIPRRDLKIVESPPKADYIIARLTGGYLLGVYENGDIWDFILGQPLNYYIDKDGYKQSTKGKLRFSHHRLILCLYERFPTYGDETRHLNGIPDDNRALNLMWGSAKDNWADRKKHGKGVERSKHHLTILTEFDIKQIRAHINNGQTNVHIGQLFGVHETTISHIRNKRTWR